MPCRRHLRYSFERGGFEIATLKPDRARMEEAGKKATN